MNTFKFSDHVHYDRHDPAQLQSVYFDVDKSFGKQLMDVLSRVEERCIADRVSELGEVLPRISQAIEERFGELTMGQLLYTVHFISSALT